MEIHAARCVEADQTAAPEHRERCFDVGLGLAEIGGEGLGVELRLPFQLRADAREGALPVASGELFQRLTLTREPAMRLRAQQHQRPSPSAADFPATHAGVRVDPHVDALTRSEHRVQDAEPIRAHHGDAVLGLALGEAQLLSCGHDVHPALGTAVLRQRAQEAAKRDAIDLELVLKARLICLDLHEAFEPAHR